MKLNLACGNSKIAGCINVDIESSVRPNVIANIKEWLPFKDELFDEIYLFHTIEHIEKSYHQLVLGGIRRVLKSNGIFYISYPEFSEISKRWLENTHGKREFWEATIYGRQHYKADYHVCAIDSTEFLQTMLLCGFRNITRKAEPFPNNFNSVMKAYKGVPFVSYESVLLNDIFPETKVDTSRHSNAN